jgi:uncharacterized protein YecT (DUF1311 family)
MHAGERQSLRRLLAAGLLACAALAAQAIDNPDAPDRVGAFTARAAPFEQQLAAADGGSAAARAGQVYAVFLEAELNAAYLALLARLDAPARAALVESQRRWLRWRVAEQAFIGAHWTAARSGSSASLSAAQARNAMVRQRVLHLLQTLAEYP